MLLVACSGSSNEATPLASADASPDTLGGASDASRDAAVTETGPLVPCEPFGRYGSPTKTFTLPAGQARINYADVQTAFPDVDWQTLDRLYVPAGKYKSFLMNNLPKRDAARPLVITNVGGQVQVGPNDPGAGYVWVMSGGANWVLTGRYDESSKTGDRAFAGHRCGAYAGSRGKYGFFSDDAYAQGQYLHMGLSVGAATSFEIEFLEIYRSGFAGIRLNNARSSGDSAFPMENVRVHDTYVHDVDGEGFYFGWTGAPPSNLFPKLSIYNNRIVRTGNDSLQIQDLGEGTEVHHNTFAFAALRWRDNPLGRFQDNNAQVHTREGKITLHHNVFIGGASNLLSFFSAPETGDGPRLVRFEDNYFADTLSLGGYLNGTAGADSSITFARNFFRGLAFGLDELDPAATDPGVVFGRNASFGAMIGLVDNRFDTIRKLFSNLPGPNGTAAAISATGNALGAVAKLSFVGSADYTSDPKKRLESWAAIATVGPSKPPIEYQPGDLVMYEAELYECLATSTNEKPAEHAGVGGKWKKLPLPNDDVRATGPYAELGVH